MTKKLTAEDTERFRRLLVRGERQLAGDIDSLASDALSTGDGRRSIDDPTDLASDSFSQEFSLELLQRDEGTLIEIRKALARIEAGTFGRCEFCARWIPRRRLAALPHARLCVDCQRTEESP